MQDQPKITIRPNPASVADAGKVRLGGESPNFGPVRSSSAKSRAYAARSSSKGAPSSSDVGGGAPFAAARPQRGGALHPYASRLQEQLANVRVIGPLSGLDATLRAILEQFNRCWHRRLDPSDRRPQQCLTSRYEIGDHVGLAQGRHGTRARLAPLAKRSPQPPGLWTDEPR